MAHHEITTTGQHERNGEPGEFESPAQCPVEGFPVEIYNLVSLQSDVDPGTDRGGEKVKKLMALEAMREWKESVQMLEGRVERLTKWIASLTNEIYQLVGLYGLFVGVVFSIVQLDGDRRVQCLHIWSPIALCLLVCFIIGYVINKKFMEIRCIRNQFLDDKEKSEKHKLYLEKLKEVGYSRFNFKDVEKKRREELEISNAPALKKADRKELQNITSLKKVVKDLESNVARVKPEHNLSYTRLVVLGILTMSTAVLVGSFVHILCYTDSPSSNCEGCVNWHDYAVPPHLPY